MGRKYTAVLEKLMEFMPIQISVSCILFATMEIFYQATVRRVREWINVDNDATLRVK